MGVSEVAMSHETGGILLIILWMSYFLRPRLISLLIAAKAISQQKRGQNFTSFIAKFTASTTRASLMKVIWNDCVIS